MDPQLSILKTEPPKKGNSVFLGLGLTAGLHLLQLLLLVFDRSWILFFGITQLLYIVPAIFYFNKSKTTNGIDSLVFAKGLKILDSLPVDNASVKRIEDAAEDFKGVKKWRAEQNFSVTQYIRC